VAKDRSTAQALPSWSRLTEWSLLVLVILVLGLVFAWQVRVLQGQAELSAIKTTLGALRTALVLEHLRTRAQANTTVTEQLQPNPFELLQRLPVNYRGVMGPVEAATVPSGSWVFDPKCTCVGYLPLYAEWFDSPSGDVMAWYQLSGTPGPQQLVAKETYRWNGELVD
jgi:hypothetical protein